MEAQAGAQDLRYSEEHRVAQAVRTIQCGLRKNGHEGLYSDAKIRRVYLSGTHKICVCCGKIRLLRNFHPNRARTNKTASNCRSCKSNKQLADRYGLTIEEYDALWKKQKGGCAICEKPLVNRGRQRAYVDHEHGSGTVRGLLCSSCNFAIGLFKDNPELLKRAAKYVTAA